MQDSPLDFPAYAAPIWSLRTLRLSRSICAWLVIAVGVIVLAGWMLDVPALTYVLPGMASMKVNTAINLIALAIALSVIGHESRSERAVFWIAVSLVLLICTITACEYAFKIELWVDTAIFRDLVSIQFPGRMAPATLVCCLFLAAAFALIQLRRTIVIAQLMLLATATAPLTTLGGYLYRAPAMYQAAPFPVIAVHTCLCLMVLCLGGLIATESRGLVNLALSQSLAGRLFRRLFPSAVGVPLLVGFLVLGGERAGIYTTAFASALLVGSCALFFAIAVWWAASVLWTAEQALQTSKHAAEVAREVAEEASRSKDLFMAVVSHELRTPLNPILVLASLLQKRPDLPADVLDDLAVIRRNVELEARIVEDLLCLTRLQREKITLNRQTVDLHAIVEQVIDEMLPEFAQKNLRLATRLSAPRHTVWADESRMRQLLANLIGNAMKFSSDGGRVDVSTESVGEHLRVVIADEGVGIAPEVLPKLFKPFEQGAKSRSRQFGGLGLGLAIAKGFAELHEASITARSEGTGKGATFTLELSTISAPPAAPATAIPDAVGPSKPVTTASLPTAGCRILLVEDDRDTLRTMSKLLKSFGHRVITAATVAEANSQVEIGAFDLLLSDIGLPDGSGLDIVRTARQRRPTRAIAISGFGQEDDIRQSKEAGFTEHLVKPVDFELLKASIARMVAFANV